MRLTKGEKLLLCLIFVVHFALVTLTCWDIHYYILHEKPYYTGEASLIWILFLVIDFPSSIIVFITSGPGVVGLPWFIDAKNHVMSDVVWPGLVFQIVGTMNWFLIYFAVRRLWKRKKDCIAANMNPIEK